MLHRGQSGDIHWLAKSRAQAGARYLALPCHAHPCEQRGTDGHERPLLWLRHTVQAANPQRQCERALCKRYPRTDGTKHPRMTSGTVSTRMVTYHGTWCGPLRLGVDVPNAGLCSTTSPCPCQPCSSSPPGEATGTTARILLPFPYPSAKHHRSQRGHKPTLDLA